MERRDPLPPLGNSLSIKRELGREGTARVFVASDAALGREVIVKVLHATLARDVSISGFQREIMLAANLKHPQIVPILSAGDANGLPYYTMPFIPGRSLRERLSEHGPLPIPEVEGVLRDVARALAYAHGRGIVHRDIKPENVLLADGAAPTPGPDSPPELAGAGATVIDFGVARALLNSRFSAADTAGTSRPSYRTPDAVATALTLAGTALGTPAYMAPEQSIAGRAVDFRTDIYAFGVMAYELLAGRLPFEHTSPNALLAAHRDSIAPAVTVYRPDCPPALASLVMRCLAKEPVQRPRGAGEVLQVLERVERPSNPQRPPTIDRHAGQPPRRVLAAYAIAAPIVAVLADLGVRRGGLPPWVFTGAMILIALGLVALLVATVVARRSRPTPAAKSAPQSGLQEAGR